MLSKLLANSESIDNLVRRWFAIDFPYPMGYVCRMSAKANKPKVVVGLLGILKAGGAWVPLDPAYPVERLRHMLADSAPAVVLTQTSIAAMWSAEPQ